MNAEHKATCREVLAIGIRQCENLIRGNNDPYYEALLVRYKAALAALDTEAAPPVADDVALPVNEYQIEGGYGPKDWHSITLKRQPQRQGSDKWAVYRNSSVLSKDGDWEYEPLPSSRDDNFLARCRFDTPQEALAFYEKCRLDAQRRP